MAKIAQHSHESVEHYGPAWIVPMVLEVFGCPIDLDPASCPQANQVIGASRIWTRADDGLRRPWSGSVYLNPPGGRIPTETGSVNSAAFWWATLAHRFALGHVPQAFFVVFNLELFRYAQGFQTLQPLDFPICFPRDRVDFLKPSPDGPVPQGSPAHPSALVYLGPNADRFQKVFSKIGKVFPCSES